MTRTIGWGLLGTGGICRAFAEALADEPRGATLVAVGSRDGARAQAFADAERARHPQVRAHASYESLVADPQVELVYVGTPHADHAASARLALAAGKAVLCEKAFTLTRAEAESLVALAHKQRVFLMEAMWTRFLPAIAAVRRLVDEGAIGEPLTLQADFGFDCSELPATHRVLDPALGGGALLDLGIYPLSLASFLVGPITGVHAQAEVGPTGVDLHTAFMLSHANGGLSQGLCSLRSTTPWRALLLGTAGRIEIDSPFFHAGGFTLHRPGQPPSTQSLPHVGNGYAHQVAHVNECLREGRLESPVMPLDESVALMGWMDAIRTQVGVRYPQEIGG